MIWLYRILARLVYMALYLYGRGRASRDELWRGRLALDRELEPVDIWMHAASVGEARVLAYLVAFLAANRPSLRIHVTTMTRTGLATARGVMGRNASVSAFPIDATPVVTRTLDRLRPQAIAIAETEIWPNLIRLATDRSIPLVLVNGRMTERSLGKYLRFKKPLRHLLAGYDRFFFKSEADRDRFAQLGLDLNRIEVAGDMKFDAPVQNLSLEEIGATRNRLGVKPDDFLLVAGSTRPGEETLLVDVMRQLRPDHPNLKLVLAPRHLERLPEVKKVLAETGLTSAIIGEATAATDVVVVDKMGVLNSLYAAADLAFVGGTLVDIGGHNLLEPVWAKSPVVYGPSVGNVADAAAYLERHEFGVRVCDIDQLRDVVRGVITGERSFELRDGSSPESSAVATIGLYLLEFLSDV